MPGALYHRFGEKNSDKTGSPKVIYMLHIHLIWAGMKRCIEDTDDALLVVSLEIGKCAMKRMLVDIGCATI